MNDSKGEFWSVKRRVNAVIISLFILLLIAAAIWPSPVIFVAVIGVYLIVTFATFLFFTTEYYVNMLSYRKGFYLIFFILIGLALIYKIIDVSNWQLLLQLTGVGIFLDIALFQTPGISKIWNTEFDKGEYTLKTLSENNRLLRNNTTKALAFHKVIAISIEDYRVIPPYGNWNEYKEVLLSYFSHYTDNLNLHVHLIELDYNEEQQAYNSIKESFEQMIGYHGIEMANTDEKFQAALDRLESGKEVLIESDLEDSIILMPYFGNEFGFLLSVLGKGEIEANQVDAMYLLNMAYIIEWHIA